MRHETAQWMNDAQYDLESAETMLQAGRYFFVVFMCHLAIEKLLKAVIVENTGSQPPKIHNLVELAVRVGLSIPPGHQTIVNELDTMSVVTRYPDGRQTLAASLSAARCEQIVRRTTEFSKWLRQLIK
jgi:HEPN domain-containing protein